MSVQDCVIHAKDPDQLLAQCQPVQTADNAGQLLVLHAPALLKASCGYAICDLWKLHDVSPCLSFVRHFTQPLEATVSACIVCAVALQAFAENMMLCGGGSSIPEISAKFVAGLQSVSPPSLQPAMCSCPDYMPDHTLKYSSWMGAAILSKVCAWTICCLCLLHTSCMSSSRLLSVATGCKFGLAFADGFPAEPAYYKAGLRGGRSNGGPQEVLLIKHGHQCFMYAAAQC